MRGELQQSLYNKSYIILITAEGRLAEARSAEGRFDDFRLSGLSKAQI